MITKLELENFMDAEVRKKLNEIIEVVNKLEKHVKSDGMPPGIERNL